jgi:hypothetical protein
MKRNFSNQITQYWVQQNAPFCFQVSGLYYNICKSTSFDPLWDHHQGIRITVTFHKQACFDTNPQGIETGWIGLQLVWHRIPENNGVHFTKTLITNKCRKRVLSSIVAHSYMFRPCWIIFRENFFVIVTLRLHFIVEWECAVDCVLRCFWRRELSAVPALGPAVIEFRSLGGEETGGISFGAWRCYCQTGNTWKFVSCVIMTVWTCIKRVLCGFNDST